MKDKNFYKKSIKQCLAEYDSSLDGLSSVQVENRIAESKLYSIKPQKKQSLFVKFLCQIKELMVLVLLVSGIVSIVMGAIERSTSEIVDGAIILGIVVMNALFGVFQERKSEKAIDSLKKISSRNAFCWQSAKN